ncbi:hypothetical protein AADR41_27265 [Streptomyces sp. CLV115]
MSSPMCRRRAWIFAADWLSPSSTFSARSRQDAATASVVTCLLCA